MATSRKKKQPKSKQREAREARAARVKIVGAHDLAVVRLRAYTIVDNAVLDGVIRGVNRAFKHTESPDPESIKGAVSVSVMETLRDIIDFGDES